MASAVGSSTSMMPETLARDLVITLIINYFPMHTIIQIGNQLVTQFVVQIWFRKNGYHLSLNRTEFEGESTNANIGKNLQTGKESGQALSEG